MFDKSYVTVDEGKLQTSYETLACAHRWSWLFACVDSTPSAFPCLINIWFILERMSSCDYTHWQTLTGLRCGFKTWRRPQRPLQAWWLSTASMATSSSASKVLSFVYNCSLWNTTARLVTLLCSKEVMSVLLKSTKLQVMAYLYLTLYHQGKNLVCAHVCMCFVKCFE